MVVKDLLGQNTTHMHRFILIIIFLSAISIQANSQDSLQFVGRVWYMQDTGEFYTILNFKDSVNQKEATQLLTEHTDSIVTKEYYLSRKVVNENLAQKYFEFNSLQKIVVFNESHQKVADATFKRVEYYKDMIDGMFIAIFDPIKMDPTQKNQLIFYGIGANLSHNIIDKFHHEEITKNALDKNIRKYIEYNKDGLLKSKHLEMKQSTVKKVSILSIEDLENFTFSTYLLEHEGSKINTLKMLNEDFVFWDLLPVPILIHNKPVFIVEIIIPDSDYTGYMLAIYDGKDYQLKEKMMVGI